MSERDREASERGPGPHRAPTGPEALESLAATDVVIAMQQTAGNRKTTRWLEGAAGPPPAEEGQPARASGPHS